MDKKCLGYYPRSGREITPSPYLHSDVAYQCEKCLRVFSSSDITVTEDGCPSDPDEATRVENTAYSETRSPIKGVKMFEKVTNPPKKAAAHVYRCRARYAATAGFITGAVWANRVGNRNWHDAIAFIEEKGLLDEFDPIVDEIV